MQQLSQTEENYLKAIFKISEPENKAASTNEISQRMTVSAASVSDMVKRLAKKELIHYEKHRGVVLTETGHQLATQLIRKHRLWEVFLVEKLDFSWDEVHEIAEELEHIESVKLINQLDAFLGHPRFDPHGDPIPDAEGNYAFRKQILLAELPLGKNGIVVGVLEHSSLFLQYLDQTKLNLGATFQILEKYEYDQSLKIQLADQSIHLLTHKVAKQILVQQKN
jgi:DtxR family transcriptional regulator, Mn-dependent transcriptional regulator